MKALLTLILLFILNFIASAQIVAKNQVMLPMSDTYQKAYKLGAIYYQTGTNTPFSGILYGKYANGNYQTIQEYVHGVGNGKWVDFSPEGIKECEGTYKDNRVEGPVAFFMKIALSNRNDNTSIGCNPSEYGNITT